MQLTMYTPLPASDKCSLEDDPTKLLIELRVMLFAKVVVQTLGVSMISPKVSCLFRLCWVVDEGGGIDELASVVVGASNAVTKCDWKSPGKSLVPRQQRLR